MSGTLGSPVSVGRTGSPAGTRSTRVDAHDRDDAIMLAKVVGLSRRAGTREQRPGVDGAAAVDEGRCAPQFGRSRCLVQVGANVVRVHRLALSGCDVARRSAGDSLRGPSDTLQWLESRRKRSAQQVPRLDVKAARGRVSQRRGGEVLSIAATITAARSAAADSIAGDPGACLFVLPVSAARTSAC
jgi:hypothetical protein